ncbi:MAG TPA: hypothetical protein VEL03_10020 [Streptosporangiaceae bacterium]|nr:hypothetical protein [Streptosporangiaceae bacterium]
MNSQVRIARSRGAVSAAALILLGLWGGLAPFAGPNIHFGFTPDTAWHYTTGRLYLSAIPGGAAVLGGLLVLVTRSRFVGVAGGLLGALGGAWFIVGSGVMLYLLKRPSISAGVPLAYSPASGPYTVRAYAEVLALFGGVGALILFFGALACGRMSLVGAQDIADTDDIGYYPDYPASPAGTVPDQGNYGTGQFPTAAGQFPNTGRFPRTQFPDNPTGQFPTATGHFPGQGDPTQPSALPSSALPDGPPVPAPDEPAQ